MATQKKSKPQPFCRAVGLIKWECNFNGVKYNIEKGVELDVHEEWHFEKLTSKWVNVIRRID